MASLEELRNERLKKLEILKKAGVEVYPARTSRTHSLHQALESFDELSKKETVVVLAGRVMAARGQGAIVFIDLYDGTDRFQSVLKKDDMDETLFTLFKETVDMGDFIEVSGVLFTTQRGQQSLAVSMWKMLSKSLRPLPDKWHGLSDEDIRHRKRYLDILLNEQIRDMITKKALFWQSVRDFHVQKGFTEVQTPILETTTGGADANPFETHHNALDLDLYLRISAGELWQKRLMVAGLEKTFEIGRIFRNEGMSPEHAQDYNQCEAYWAYADFTMMYTFLKECYQYAAEQTFGTLKFTMRGFDVDLSGDWPLVDYAEEIQKQTGIDIWSDTEDKIENKLKEFGVEYEGVSRERLIDSLWKYCRKTIGGPAILINEPKFMSPLAKTSTEDERVTERFHFLIAGSEVGQGYSELNDPIDQKERFEKQQALRDSGDEEAQMADYEFVEALEHGMPPTAGHGFSDRLFSFFMDMPIRETETFPLMRPKKEIIADDE